MVTTKIWISCMKNSNQEGTPGKGSSVRKHEKLAQKSYKYP